MFDHQGGGVGGDAGVHSNDLHEKRFLPRFSAKGKIEGKCGVMSSLGSYKIHICLKTSVERARTSGLWYEKRDTPYFTWWIFPTLYEQTQYKRTHSGNNLRMHAFITLPSPPYQLKEEWGHPHCCNYGDQPQMITLKSFQISEHSLSGHKNINLILFVYIFFYCSPKNQTFGKQMNISTWANLWMLQAKIDCSF